MCNLYSYHSARELMEKNIHDMAITRVIGNLPPQPGIFPDMQAPVIANTSEGKALTKMRWGMPSPKFALKGKNYDKGITNVRNTKSGHWRRWLGVENRCIVPLNSFAEPGPDRKNVWFALNPDRPLMFFAGVWTNHTSVRKVKDGETTDDLYAFLTTEPNNVVAPIHPKAMPVILRTDEDIETWLTAPMEEALELQRPLPDDVLEIVARGGKQDGIEPEDTAQGDLL